MNNLKFQIQALLFVAPEPVNVKELARTLGTEESTIQAGLDDLQAYLEGSGLALIEHHDSYQLVTATAYGPLIKEFLGNESKNELSRAAMETLAIIAYKGPITKSEIEQIRGVSSETMLRNLLQRNLVIESGKAKIAGRPPLFAVSHEFLQSFGLSKLSDLPPIDEAAA